MNSSRARHPRPGGSLRVAQLGWAAIGLLLVSGRAAGQGPPPGQPPSPVRYTEAREGEVRRAVRLPGTAESRLASLVAAEVAGVVVRLDVREGDAVKKGQPLALLRSDTREAELKVVRSQMREAESRMRLAELNLARARDLAAAQVASQQELDTATEEAAAWRGRVESLQAQITRLELDVEHCTIRAPFSGAVVAKRTEVGQWLAAGGPVAEILSLDAIEVRVEVPERYVASLKPGAAASVTFPALDGLTIDGTVAAVVAQASAGARTFPVKVRIDNDDRLVQPGMLAEVSFPAGDVYRATLVPKDAVVTQGTSRLVYRMQDDGTTVPIAVTPGQGVGAWVAVDGEVKPGERVITRGNERLYPGLRVAGEALEYPLP